MALGDWGNGQKCKYGCMSSRVINGLVEVDSKVYYGCTIVTV